MFLPAALAVATLAVAQPPAPPKFEIKDGDRIVWIGSTLVEREQRYGYWEAALHMAFPDKQFTLRNLGWSGDTVFGDARAGFDNQAKGFERLVSLALELKPTVIFVSYGANESFEGEAGLPKFEKGLEKLLDALKPANARVVLFSPAPVNEYETPAGVPDPKARNKTIAAYGEAVRKVAEKRGLFYADIYTPLVNVFEKLDGLSKAAQQRNAGGPVLLTENGVHLDGRGYEISSGLAFLPSLGNSDLIPNKSSGPFWASAYPPLCNTIVAKNQLFFYRWRPQNETYLFGFRKHEQGKNAKEVAEFDPLVAKVEEEIEKTRKELVKPK